MSRPLFVTRPLLPPLPDLNQFLNGIWDRQIVTNCGPLHEELETELGRLLNVPSAMLFNNATVALLCALKLFDLPKGSEVITTPLTFAATAHSIDWNGLKPVFADVSEDTLTLDPEAVRKAIGPKTSAILAVHVYGTICDVDALDQVAKEHGLRLIYDAAHAFAAEVDGRPVGSFGDASVFSFHATKLFTTLEGGLIASPDPATRQKLHFLRNFGIKSEEEVVSVGINGKMNEVQAAIGLLNLKAFEAERAARSRLRDSYEQALGGLRGIRFQKKQPGVTQSEQYFPIIVDPAVFGRTRDDIYEALKSRGIMSRKYFHPICTDFEPYRGFPIVTSDSQKSVVERIKSQVLCLPFFSGVTDEDVEEIASVFHGRA